CGRAVVEAVLRRRSCASARAAVRARESALGLPADRRRVAEARRARVAKYGAPVVTRSRPAAGTRACRAEPAGFPLPAGREHARVRLLHCRDDFTSSLLCVVLPRAW